jgi:hypothetical protein
MTAEDRSGASPTDLHVHIESGVSLFDGKPFVSFRWGDRLQHSGQFTPEAARRFGLDFIEAAEAALHDSALIKFLQAEMDIPFEGAGTMLMGVRKFRADL